MSLLKLPDINIKTTVLESDHKLSCAGIHDQQMSRDIIDTANML